MKRWSFIVLLSLFISCQQDENMEQQSGTIPVGGYSVYYETAGKGEPLLLLHAGLQNSAMWEDQVKDFSKDHLVITIDLPFHGKTTGIDTAILAKDVVKTVLDSLKIQKASVVGLSMGAAITQDFAIHYPQRVNKVVLMSSALYGYEDAHPVDTSTFAWYRKLLAALEGKDTAKAALIFTQTWSEGIDSESDSLTKQASRYVYQTTLHTLRQHQLKNWPNLQDDPKAYAGISTLRMPVLILHGDRDQPIIAETSQYLEKAIPGAKRIEMKGVAHMINMEQPAEVNKLLRAFLK